MASSGSGYDLSTSTFSPDGRIFQVEYASKAVSNASTVIGIVAKDGVVLASSTPLVHPMVVPSTGSYKRIFTIDPSIGMAATGFTPDARVIVQRAVDEASVYQETYDIPIPPAQCADRLGEYMHYFTLHGSLRAFGASAVLAGYDATAHNNNGSSSSSPYTLHVVEPNGSAAQYYGVALGQGQQAAKTELELLQLHRSSTDATASISCVEATQHAAKILTLLHAENKNVTGKRMAMEMSWLCAASDNKHVGVPKDVIAAARAWADAQLEAAAADDDDDDDEDEMEEE